MRRRRAVVAVAVAVVAVVLAGVTPALAGGGPPAPSLQSNNTTAADPRPDPNATEVRETRGYTVEGLMDYPSPTDKPGIRRFGDGQIWLDYLPVSLLSPSNVKDGGRFIRNAEAPVGEFGTGTVVKRKSVWVEAWRGWRATPTNLTIRIVEWDTRTREVNTSAGIRRYTVPANVSETTENITLDGGGDYGLAEVDIPTSYDETKMVTMWVEGRRDTTQWTFRIHTSKGSDAVGISSVAGAIGWSVTNLFVWTILSASVLVAIEARVLKSATRGPGWGLVEYGLLFGGFAFFGGLFLYAPLLDTLATRPQLIGVGGGVFLALIVVRYLSDDGQKALFLQPRPSTPTVDETGAGTWWWANRVHRVVTRDSDGKKVIPRSGILAALARVWPRYDSTPVLEFEATPERTLDSPPEDFEGFEDDAGYWERVRTRLVGKPTEGDAFDSIYLVDPDADDVITYRSEGFRLDLPELIRWPESEESGVWIRGVPVPHVYVGRILAGVAAVTAVGTAVGWLLTSPALGVLAGAVTVLFLVFRPSDPEARVRLAPAQFGSVLGNLTRSLEGWSDAADKEYFREKATKQEVLRRTERAEEREETQRTTFEEISDRLAPPAPEDGGRTEDVMNGRTSSGSRGEADE